MIRKKNEAIMLPGKRMILFSFSVFFQKCSYVHKEEKATRELTHTELECVKENSTLEGKN